MDEIKSRLTTNEYRDGWDHSWRALSMKLVAGKAGGPLGAGVENREKWSTQCRGWFLLHASATTTTDYYMKSVDAMHERGLVVPHLMRADSVLPRVPPLEVLPHGVIFGMCQLVTILPKNQAIDSLAPSGIEVSTCAGKWTASTAS